MNRNLHGLYEKLRANPNDAQKTEGTRRLMVQHSEKIYLMMVDELQCRNYSDAEIGLKILCILDPKNQQYRTALDSLANNRQKLKETALARGLSEQSAYYRNNIN